MKAIASKRKQENKPTGPYMFARCDATLYDRLKRECARDKRTTSQVIRIAVSEYLARKEANVI